MGIGMTDYDEVDGSILLKDLEEMSKLTGSRFWEVIVIKDKIDRTKYLPVLCSTVYDTRVSSFEVLIRDTL